MSLMLSQPKIDLVSPVEAVAAFDPPAVVPGQQTIYRVTLSGLEASTELPDKIIAPPELDMKPGAHAEILRPMVTKFQPFTTFNYRVRASTTGEFTIPEFKVNVYGKPVVIPAARLIVGTNIPAPTPAAPHLVFELPSTNLYVGQAVRARAILPSAAMGVMQGLSQVQLTGDGFLVDVGAARQRIEMAPNAAGRSASYVYETSLTPVAAGNLSVFAQGFTIGQRGPLIMSGTAIISYGTPQCTLLESDPIAVTVRPLPQEGKLPGFAGAIGNLALGSPKLSTNVVHVGDAVTLTINVTNRGDGPLARLTPPPTPQLRDWQLFGTTEAGPPQPVNPGPVDNLQGVSTFTFTLIPLSEKSEGTPPIPFSYFDPVRGAYVDATIPSAPLTVEPGASPTDISALTQAPSNPAESEKEPVLSGLAATPGWSTSSLVPAQQRTWFPLVQLAPAVCLVGLLAWDRRRRYFEQHPDVLLRRRARRALHRDWRTARQAAQAQDGAAFAAAAVSAMRVAVAPHYPAEPRALVGSDVVAVLPNHGGPGRTADVVRRFFGVMDASRFAATAADARELLTLQPDLDQVLEQLEARL